MLTARSEIKPKSTGDGATRRQRAVVADDHLMVAEMVRQILSSHFDVIAVVTDGNALIRAVLALQPDLVVADVAMPEKDGITAFQHLKKECCNVPFLFLSMFSAPTVVASALSLGAKGFVLKSSAGDELLEAALTVAEGRHFISPALAITSLIGVPAELTNLTARQRDVVCLLMDGVTRSREIAARLHLSVRTAEAHRRALMRLFDVHSTLALVNKVKQLGFQACRSLGRSALRTKRSSR